MNYCHEYNRTIEWKLVWKSEAYRDNIGVVQLTRDQYTACTVHVLYMNSCTWTVVRARHFLPHNVYSFIHSLLEYYYLFTLLLLFSHCCSHMCSFSHFFLMYSFKTRTKVCICAKWHFYAYTHLHVGNSTKTVCFSLSDFIMTRTCKCIFNPLPHSYIHIFLTVIMSWWWIIVWVGVSESWR